MLTTNVLIFINFCFFFYQPYRFNFLFFCVPGTQSKNRKLKRGGVSAVAQGLTHLGGNTSFLPFYYILYYIFFYSRVILCNSSCCFLLNKQKKTRGVTERVRESRQGLTHLGWYFTLFSPFNVLSVISFFYPSIILFHSPLIFLMKNQNKLKGSEKAGTGVTARLDTFGIMQCLFLCKILTYFNFQKYKRFSPISHHKCVKPCETPVPSSSLVLFLHDVSATS